MVAFYKNSNFIRNAYKTFLSLIAEVAEAECEQRMQANYLWLTNYRMRKTIKTNSHEESKDYSVEENSY